MSRKKYFVVAIVIVLALLGGLLGFLWQRHVNRPIIVEDETTRIFVRNIENLIFAEQSLSERKEIVFVVTEELRLAPYWPDKGIVLVDRENRVIARQVSEDGRTIAVLNVFSYRDNYHIYDLFTGERVETIDVLDLTKNIDDYFHSSNLAAPLIVTADDGEIYAQWRMRKIRSSNNEDWVAGYLQMNLATREAFFSERHIGYQRLELEANEREYRNRQRIFWCRTNLLEANGIEIDSSSEFFVDLQRYGGMVEIRLLATLLPKESEALYSRFPGLQDFIGMEDLWVRVLIEDYPEPEEILTMFMEDGREISFEGVVLPANMSVDGNSHEIGSFAEFDRWVASFLPLALNLRTD